MMENRFEQIDKRLESMQHSIYKRFDVLTVHLHRYMRWSFGLTLTAAGIIIAVLEFT